MTAGSLISEVLRRVRDPNGTAHGRTFVLSLLDSLQVFVNAQTAALLGEATVTVSGPYGLLNIALLLPTTCVRVEAIRDGTRDLPRADSWRVLAQADRGWLGRPGSRPETWCRIGPSWAAIYPVPADPFDLTLVFVRKPVTLTTEAVTVELPAPLIPALVTLAEEVLLLRQRLFPSMQVAQSRFGQAVGATSR